MQPIQLVSYPFLLAHFSILEIPFGSANMIFQFPGIFLLACASFGFVVVVEIIGCDNRKNFNNFIIVYMFLLGGFAAFFVGLSTDTMEILWIEAGEEMNDEMVFWNDIALIYALGGGFLYELYQIYHYKIAKKITGRWLFEIFQRL